MPWRVADVDKYMSGLTRQQKRQWVNVANSALKACQKAGKDDCDAQAIIRANGVLSRQKEKSMKAKTAAEAKMQPVGEIVSPASALPETNENDAVAENYGDSYPSYYVPMDVLTFAQLDNTEEASDIQRKVQELTDKFFTLTRNIIYSPEGVDRLGGMKNLTAEYIERLAVILESESEPPESGNNDMPADEMPVEPGEASAGLSEAERLSEADTSQIMALSETPAPGEVLKLDVAIIRPGWGNKTDKHYYPKEMLSQYADRFVGAKMYETDHRPEEKSTRTWVSTVTEIVGFTDDGAPIGRVAVHDPGFAARMRNLDEAKLLDKMACSILATGRAQAYEENGVKGKKVTEIVEVESVDWVTRAGAGGQALNLAESEGGMTMEVEQTEQAAQETEQPQEPEVETETAAEAQPEPETPVNLEEAEIVKIISASTLPDASKRRLAKLAYATEQELAEAVSSEIAYLKEATGSGQVVGMGETQKQPVKQYNPEAVAEAADRVNKKYFGGHNG